MGIQITVLIAFGQNTSTINPGDRASDCGGMMRPVSVEKDRNGFIITHKCEKCGKTIRQHTNDNDNMDTIITLSVDNSFIFGK